MKYVIAFFVPICAVITLVGSLDNDSWFVLAEGRQIVEHGIYYTDELSMHSDFAVTVHNYGYAVIFWLIYSTFGAPGLYIFTLILFLLLLWLIYKTCMLLSNKNVNLSLILMMLTGLVMSFGFIVTRGQMISYIVMAALIYVLELFIATDKAKYLAWIPVLSFISINMRAAMWWMIFIVIFAYLIDAIKKPKWHLQGYRTKPMLIASLIAMAVGMLNPYGINMILFIFRSYGVTEISNFVNEMKPFNPLSGVSLIVYIAIAAVLLLYIFGKKKYIRVRHLILFFGLLLLGLSSKKMIGELSLIMFLPLARLYKDWQVRSPIEDSKLWMFMVSWMGIVTIAVTVCVFIEIVLKMEDKPRIALVESLDAIDANVPAGKEKKDLKVYVNYDNGGYVEFRGYKAFLDPRAEVFIKRGNGKADVLKEWQKAKGGRTEMQELVSKYDFDFLMVRKNDPLYDYPNANYELIYDNGDEEDGDRVYKKVEND